MATWDHFYRQNEFYIHFVASVTHLEIGKKNISRTHWLQRSKSKINKKYNNAPNH